MGSPSQRERLALSEAVAPATGGQATDVRTGQPQGNVRSNHRGSKHLEHAARVFHALADGTRLEIIDHLRNGKQCFCDLTDALETGQSRLSFHLKALKDAGILIDRREGRWIYYSLNPQAIEELERLIGSLKPRPGGFRVASSRCD